MAEKNSTKKDDILTKKLGKGYKLEVLISPVKNGNIPWRAIIADTKEDHLVAIFNKPLERNRFTTAIQGHELQLNNNGVQATYLDWRTAVEKLIEVKIPWRPTGREMFRLNI